MVGKTDGGAPNDVIVGVGNALVYIIEDRVAVDVKNLGRLELPAAAAIQLAHALLEGARKLREEKPKTGTLIL